MAIPKKRPRPCFNVALFAVFGIVHLLLLLQQLKSIQRIPYEYADGTA